MVPFALENIGNEPVSGVHLHEAAFGQLGGLAATLYGLFAQNGNFVVARLHFRLNAQCDLQRHGRDEAEEKLADRPVDMTSRHGLATWGAMLTGSAIACIACMGPSFSAVILHDQVAAADTAQGNTLEQSGPFPGRPLQ